CQYPAWLPSSLARASPSLSITSRMATEAPSSTIRQTVALPMPMDLPVTMTTLPLSLSMVAPIFLVEQVRVTNRVGHPAEWSIVGINQASFTVQGCHQCTQHRRIVDFEAFKFKTKPPVGFADHMPLQAAKLAGMLAGKLKLHLKTLVEVNILIIRRDKQPLPTGIMNLAGSNWQPPLIDKQRQATPCPDTLSVFHEPSCSG